MYDHQSPRGRGGSLLAIIAILLVAALILWFSYRQGYLTGYPADTRQAAGHGNAY